MLLRDKVAAVTGAGRGIGRGIALELARHGADLVLNDLDEERVQGTAQAVRDLGRRVALAPGSVADPATADRLLRTAVEVFGRLDILVNNAGINRDALLHKMTDAQFDEVLDVDLKGVFYTTRAAAIHMRERGSGRIINLSSASWLGNIGQANYAAAKAGVVGLTKTAARELARYGVTCNVICPGFIDTEMTRAVPPKVWDLMVSKIPMGRVGQPEDVGKVVVFLASDLADYVTGEVINVGGGMVL